MKHEDPKKLQQYEDALKSIALKLRQIDWSIDQILNNDDDDEPEADKDPSPPLARSLSDVKSSKLKAMLAGLKSANHQEPVDPHLIDIPNFNNHF